LVNFDRVLVVAGPHSHRSLEMSALGQKQTSAHVRVLSASPPKADITQRCCHVRFVPKAHIRCAPAQRKNPFAVSKAFSPH
jgi:hypothetical protein